MDHAVLNRLYPKIEKIERGILSLTQFVGFFVGGISELRKHNNWPKLVAEINNIQEDIIKLRREKDEIRSEIRINSLHGSDELFKRYIRQLLFSINKSYTTIIEDIEARKIYVKDKNSNYMFWADYILNNENLTNYESQPHAAISFAFAGVLEELEENIKNSYFEATGDELEAMNGYQNSLNFSNQYEAVLYFYYSGLYNAILDKMIKGGASSSAELIAKLSGIPGKGNSLRPLLSGAGRFDPDDQKSIRLFQVDRLNKVIDMLENDGFNAKALRKIRDGIKD